MSSSKIFKRDTLFIPTTLVRYSIPLPREKKARPAEAPAADGSTVQKISPEIELPEVLNEPEHVPALDAEPAAPAIDIEAIRQEAYNRGMADLAAQLKMDLNQAVSAFAEGCQKFDGLRTTMFQRNRAELVNLVVMIAEKILRHELTTSRNVIAATLEAALEQAIESEEFYVTLHPDDLAVAEAKAPELIASIRGLSRLVFKADPHMSRGGCLLESLSCSVDASIELQLDNTREFLEQQPVFVPPADDEFAAASVTLAGETPAEA